MIYLVTGLMRSGTSVIAQHLHELGIPMGTEMRFPTTAKNHLEWEDTRFTDACFKQLIKKHQDSGQIGAFFREYIPSREGESWGCKSPFALPYANTFKIAAERLGHEVKIITTYRPTYDTIHSLRELTEDDDLFYTIRAVQEKLIGNLNTVHTDLQIDIKDTWLSPTSVRESLAQLIRSS
jgi:hypothetical protein